MPERSPDLPVDALYALYGDRARLAKLTDRRYSRKMSTQDLVTAWAAAKEARILGSRTTDELHELVHDGKRTASQAMIDAIDRGDTTAVRHEEMKVLAPLIGTEASDLYGQVEHRLERTAGLERALSSEATRRVGLAPARITRIRVTTQPEATP